MLKIAHISDTQIRNFKRHWEYKESYKNLYDSLRKEKPDVIVIAGDIAHTKTQISPEFVQVCSEFFKNLANIAPLHIIPGNHDGNLKNLTRLDALTPIIDALGHENIYYYKYSGVYKPFYSITPFLGSIRFVVFSCFDENWPTEVPQDTINIGLYHGFVKGATLQNGMVVDNCPQTVEGFLSVVDYLLLGDIHKTQFFDRAAYCGSYPQQNFGEDLDKGYLLWTIESKDDYDVRFVKLPNVCPFYTLVLDDDLKIPELDLQKEARIRVFSRQLTTSEQQLLTDRIKSLYSPRELYFKDEMNAHRQEITLSKNATIEDLSDAGVQEQLIREFLDSYQLSEESMSGILELNKRLDIEIRKEDEVLRNVQYKLGKMRWSNLFSYGEGNEFDFSERHGLVGVFGKNATGKSSLAVDIPLYVLFNTNSKRVVKNDEIINEKKDHGGAEIDVRIGATTYKINRTTGTYIKSGKKEGNPIVQGVTEIDFGVVNHDGSIENKNGEARADTDKEIRKIFGTADDFMSTSMAPQWKLINFIEKGGTERLKLIGRYFDIDIFSQKHKIANDEWKDLKGQLRLYEGRDFESERQKTQESHQEKTASLTALEQKREKLLSVKAMIDKQIELVQVSSVSRQNKVSTIELQLRNEKTQLDRSLSKIENLQKYKCIANPDCCFRDELKEYESTTQRHRQKIEELKVALEEEKQVVVNEDASKLNDLKKKKKKIEDELSNNHQAFIDVSRQLGSFDAVMKEIEVAQRKFDEIKQSCEIYEYFMSAMSKDGIARTIIANNIGLINKEISKIMSNIGFTVELAVEDGGKAVEIYFKHEKSKLRRIELCSGMEKTLASIAIRAALISVTTLPKSNVYILDEVFSSLDPEYVDAVSGMLEYLKTMFDSVIIITHIDTFKDLVDYVIEVERDEEGLARIV